jgi:small subunit ribosomal protein S17
MAAPLKFGGRKVRQGIVVSDKMQKTVLVAVESFFRHRLYKKRVRRLKRYMVHDEEEVARLGDRVRIVESRPLSRHKRWRVVEVLTRAQMPEIEPEAIDLELLGQATRKEGAIAEPEAEGREADPGDKAKAEAAAVETETTGAGPGEEKGS